MRIRFFNTFEPITAHYRDLLPLLADNGASIEAIVSSAEYRPGRVVLEKILSSPRIRVTRIPSGCDTSSTMAKKIQIMATYAVGTALYTLLGARVDLNFFLTQPPLFAAWGYVLKLLRGQPYFCLIMDLYPDLAIQAGLIGARSLPTRVMLALSRFSLRHADMVITIGRCTKEYLERVGVRPERIQVITNWANEKEVYPVPFGENRLRRELGAEGDFVVLYTGNLGVSHFFDDLIEVARRLSHIGDLRFVVFGDGPRRGEFEDAKGKYGLDNLWLLPYQPPERRAEAISFGNVHFISLRTGFEALVVPSKAYPALAAGRPIIYQGSESGEIARMIAEEEVGFVVGENDPDGLEQAILECYENPAVAASQGDRAHQLALTRFDRTHLVGRLKDLIWSRSPALR